MGKGLKVCEHKCDQCLFSPNRIVSKSRVAQIIRNCLKKDIHFECHKGTIEGVAVVCRGFYDQYPTQLIRIAERLNVVEFVNPETINQVHHG